MKNQALFNVAKKLLQDHAFIIKQREEVCPETHAQFLELLKHTYSISPCKAGIDTVLFMIFGQDFNQFYSKVETELENQIKEREALEWETVRSMTVEEYYNTILDKAVNFGFKTARDNREWPKEYYAPKKSEVFVKPIHEAMSLPMEHFNQEHKELTEKMDKHFGIAERPTWFDEQMQAHAKSFFGIDLSLMSEGKTISFPKAKEVEKTEIIDLSKLTMRTPCVFCLQEHRDYACPEEIEDIRLKVNSRPMVQSDDKDEQITFTFDLPDECFQQKAPVTVRKTNGDNQLIEESLSKLRVQISQYKQLPKEQRGTLLIEAQDKFNRLKNWMN